MAKNPKGAYDKGYRDGRQKTNEEKNYGTIQNLIWTLTNPTYKPDKDYPESYKKGFKEGKKNGWKKSERAAMGRTLRISYGLYGGALTLSYPNALRALREALKLLAKSQAENGKKPQIFQNKGGEIGILRRMICSS